LVYFCILAAIGTVAAGQGPSPEQSPAAVRALIEAGRYQDAEVAAERLVADAAGESAAESPEAARAIDLLVDALLRNGKGSQPRTRVLAERAINIKQARLGPDNADLSLSLQNLGNTLLAAGDARQSLPFFERVLDNRQRTDGPQAIAVAAALDERANAERQSGLDEVAKRSLIRSLSIKETILGPGDRGIARTLEQLALVEQNLGNYRSARPLLERSQRIRDAVNGQDLELSGTLVLLGDQALFEGDAQAARRLYLRALEIRRSYLRPDHPQIAVVLKSLGGATRDLGDYPEAKALREKALSIAETNFGPVHPLVAGYLNDLANTDLLLGDYATARVLYERALKIIKESRQPDAGAAATYTYNLALLHARLGDLSEARRQLDRAIALWQQAKGRDHPFVAVAIGALGRRLAEQGAYAEAQALQERALRIRERSLGPDHLEVAKNLTDLADTLESEGYNERAQMLSTRAVGIFERSPTRDVPAFAVVLARHASIQIARGEFELAVQYYGRALEITGRVFGQSHPDYADVQAGLALALARSGESSPAVESALRAEATGRQHLRLTLRSLPERQSLEYAARRPKGLDLAMSLSATSGWPSGQVFEALIKTRGLVLDEMAARRRASTDSSRPDLAPLWTALTAARQRLANLVVRGPNDQQPQQYVTLVENARQEKELAERALADKSAAFQDELTRSDVGLDDVRAALPAQSALVAFALYERTLLTAPPATVTSVSAQSTRRRRTVPSYMAFIIKAGDPVVAAVPLGSASNIDLLVARWHDEVKGILVANSTDEAQRSYRVAGTALRNRLWDPVARYLKDQRTVFIVPDGSLNLVSFATLPATRTKYLVDDGPVIHYLSAERDLVTKPATRNANSGLLALGGAAFDDATLFTRAVSTRPVKKSESPTVTASSSRLRATCGDLASMHFESLDGTGAEVQEVAKLWTGSPARVLRGRDANERAFKRAAQGNRVLHLATHGFFLGSACSPAAGSTRSVGGLSKPGDSRSSAGLADNPLLLSGLALAGANRRSAAGPDDDDGILTAEEVAGLNLNGVEWAVLSACDTGLGALKTGEGVFGLRRAFQLAGAQTVIMSLWQVDDEAARDWMRALYAGRQQKKLTTADAVREASLTMLRDRRAKGLSTHPFYWGAFVAAGDWR
jgi:CHAT domain-containing protein